MEDVKFVQKYSEVVLENFNAVLKQNLLFQAKLAIVEEELARKNREQTDNELLKKEIQKLLNEKNQIQNELNSKNELLKTTSGNNIDKNRIQNALNEEYKKSAVLQNTINELENEIEKLKSKKRKVNKKVEEEQKISKEETSVLFDNVPLRIESAGGTF